MKPDEKKPAASPQEPSPGFLVRKCFEEQGFKIGDGIEVRVYRILGNKVILAVKAPRDVEITLAE